MHVRVLQQLAKSVQGNMIVNCSTLFHELEVMLKVKTASNSQSVRRS